MKLVGCVAKKECLPLLWVWLAWGQPHGRETWGQPHGRETAKGRERDLEKKKTLSQMLMDSELRKEIKEKVYFSGF